MTKPLEVCYDMGKELFLDVYLPKCRKFSVFVYFHGGGLRFGDKSSANVFAHYMNDHGIVVISANYRMYPNAKYPEFLEDAAAVVSWTYANMRDYGEVTDVYVGGSSAGGYISQMLCFDKTWLGKHGIKPTDIAGFVMDAGQPTCHFNVLRERGIDTRRVIVDETAPIYYVGTEEQYPSMLVIVSDDDMENRYEQTMLLISTMKHFGHADKVQLKVMNGTHCAYVSAVDTFGEPVFGKIIVEYIEGRKG